ncbi:MAG: FecR domain-containing protein [Myxococcota bacterium]
MSSEPSFDRREYVKPDLSEERVASNWNAITARKRRRGAPWIAVAAAAAVLLGVGGWFATRSPVEGWAGTTLTAANETVRAHMEDGSEIVAAPHTALRRVESTEDETRLRLERGEARFEVTRDPSRTFVVLAGDVEVRVIGTRFTVRQGPQVSVEVERGAVDVRHGEETRRLRAGESWQQGTSVAAVAPPTSEGSEVDTQEEAPRTRMRRRRSAPTPSELFEAAREARRSGDAREAATLYDRLVRRHPSDGRAGLAAFELGRLRMDQLRDPRGALRAFRRALRSGGPFREDAMARIAQAEAAAGNASGCRRARTAYLDRYPNGRFRRAVESACAE